MGKHHKTEIQERIFYDHQIVMPQGAMFVLRQRRWDEQTLTWVALPGRHRLREDAELTNGLGGPNIICDVCTKGGVVVCKKGGAVVWDDLFGNVCNYCLIKNVIWRDTNFMTGEKLGRNVGYPQYLLANESRW